MSDEEPLFTVAVAERHRATRQYTKGVWRLRARAVIVDVISECRDDVHPARLTRKEALALVDAAYPFGERAMAPYKAWLAERKLFIEAFDEPAVDVADPPDADEVSVCEVAADLVEEGKLERAAELVAEQAPRRLARRCPACDVAPGMPCLDIAGVADSKGDHAILIVPHLARLVPPAAASGPLFGAP